MRIHRSAIALSSVLVFGSVSLAFAQPSPAPQPGGAPRTTTATGTTANPTFELSAGYQYLRLPDQNFPFGLAIDGARHYNRMGLVGEVGWSRHSDEESGVDFSSNMFHFAAGPRWTGFSTGRWWPYAQVLVGAAIARTGVEIDDIETDETNTAFMLQPGVGVTFVAGDGWGLFGQVDYRRTFFDEPDVADDEVSVNNQFRIFVGARMILD